MTKPIYQSYQLPPTRASFVFWRLIRNGVVVGDGLTKSEARRNAASFIRSVRRQNRESVFS